MRIAWPIGQLQDVKKFGIKLICLRSELNVASFRICMICQRNKDIYSCRES